MRLTCCLLALLMNVVTPREKAEELLNSALDMAPGTQPETAATSLLRIAENYDLFNHAKAVEIVKRAFDVSLGIPPGDERHREMAQSQVALVAVQLSLPDAVEMLRRIDGGTGDYDPRQPAINAAVAKILDAKMTGSKQFDEAIEFINSVGATGQYPFAGARLIYEKLPGHDPRRSALFGYSLSAYALRPGSEFGDFLVAHWKEIPRSAAEAAIGSVVETVLNTKDDGLTETIASNKGPLVLKGRANVELFDLMHIVRTTDPKRADEILQSRPDLKAALSRFPNGRESMGRRFAWSRGYDSNPAEAISNSRLAEVVAELEKVDVAEDASDEVQQAAVEKMLKLVKTIPAPETRIQMLAGIAGEAGTDDPLFGHAILGECMELLKDVKVPEIRIDAWNSIAEAAHEIKDDKLAWEALDHSLADAAEILKLDSDADNPNRGSRDWWPSTNAYRRVVIAAVKMFGINAEPLLLRIQDPEIALYARVEMAQALLERPHGNWMTSFRSAKK